MRELPILFSGPLVRAILEGRKTQTRRPLKQQPVEWRPGSWSWPGPFSVEPPHRWTHAWHDPHSEGWVEHMLKHCPFGAPRDRLWVRETWRPRVAHSHGMDACDCGDVNVEYRADGAERFIRDGSMPNEWVLPRAAKTGDVPSIHMPRWASRLVLEVTEVRVERLQAITEEGARAEGLACDPTMPEGTDTRPTNRTCRGSFALLWDSIYGALPWHQDPWVWVVSFRRLP